jgi:predicted RNase H-like nuclease (RuvC/YqgF family)
VETSKRKTCNLSIRVTSTELTWLAEKAQEHGCLSISEYTRNVLFQATKVDQHREHIAQLERDLQSLRQDVEKLSSRLSNAAQA